jgi:sulfite reductase beta subunit-like hemoprotein
MQTGDGLLARLNTVAGGLSPKALIGLCESALRHGSGIVEVTARGSVQIRGLTPRSAQALARDVDALEIEIRSGMPVETGPLAGMDAEEITDPRPLASEIRNAIARDGLAARLGPKVCVVVDGGGRRAGRCAACRFILGMVAFDRRHGCRCPPDRHSQRRASLRRNHRHPRSRRRFGPRGKGT